MITSLINNSAQAQNLESNETVGYTSNTSFGNSVLANISKIRDLIRNCTVLPYFNNQNGVREYSDLQVNCAQIKLESVTNRLPRAKIKVGQHQFLVTIQESEGSDADFYDVEIRDIKNNDKIYINSVLAYGDVLMAIMNGDARGIQMKKMRR